MRRAVAAQAHHASAAAAASVLLSGLACSRGVAAPPAAFRTARRNACPFSGSATDTAMPAASPLSSSSSSSSSASACPEAASAAASSGGTCPLMGSVPATACPVESEDMGAVAASMTPKQIINQLGKSRLSGFVTSTATAGYVLCGGTSVPVAALLTLGTYLQSLSANTSNQIIEVENDRMMKRTHKRPLVVGAITRPGAALLAATELAVGTGMLAAACGPTVAALGVANWAMYVGVYTPLKRVSTTNTWWGAIVGAVPPVMGGAAAVTAGGLTSPALAPAYLLGGVMFVWQIPHFMSLAFHCRRDYEKAGFKMLPYSHPTRASVYAVALSVVMAGMTLPLPAAVGMAVEPWFYVASAAANAGMVYKSVKFHMHPEKYCRSCFVFSYMYLAVMLALLVANHFQPLTAATHLYAHYLAPARPHAPPAVVAAAVEQKEKNLQA